MPKSTHGGRRDGAGRPKTLNRKNLVIDASEAEYKQITGKLSTRQRTDILLAAIERIEQ